MILETGGTSLIGGEVLRLLSQAGVPARAPARNPQKGLELPHITWVTADLSKPDTLPAAFNGTTTLFLVTSIGESTFYLQHNAVAAAHAAGVSLKAMMRAAFARWHVEKWFERARQEAGFGSLEVPRYRALMRHWLCSAIVMDFLADQTQRLQRAESTDHAGGGRRSR